MGRKIRHLVEADGLVEITGRCIQRRFLLRPSAKLNAVIRGVLARAQERHHWPGASSTKALLSGERVEGIWIDRTAQYRAWERGELNPDARFTSVHRLELSPIPCWAHLRPHQYQARVRALVREIERSMEGVQVLGKRAICAQRRPRHGRALAVAGRSMESRRRIP